jgi:glycosyltransferase involved in cell wall biosynthesis
MLPEVLLPGVPAEQLCFVPWAESTEVATLQRLDVGLMPLPDTPWTRGKCSYKMLQYMACAIPVLVSPVGMNQEVLALGDCGLAATDPADWQAGLEALHQDAGKRGKVGRRIVEERFSLATLTPKLATSLRAIHGGPA